MGENSFMEGYITGRDGGNGCNNGMFGNDMMSWWFVIVMMALWGGNGFGNNGRNGVTQAELCQGFNANNLENGVRGISQGICDSTFALNNSITTGNAAAQQTMCQGFSGVNTAILQSSNQVQQGITQLGYNLQSCCCNLSREIESLRTSNAQNTCEIINNQNQNTQRMLDFMCQEKIAGLQAQNAALTAQLSQNAQTDTFRALLAQQTAQLQPTPVPAYSVFPPNLTYAYPSGVQFGTHPFNNGCGSCCGI